MDLKTKKKSPRHRPPPECDKLVLADGRTLLTTTENMETGRLFVAGTRQDQGKTTTCLGLFGALQTCYKQVAYIKPIGQRYIELDGMKIDEDCFLLDSIYDVGVPIEAMSPIAIEPDFTRRFLNNPEDLRPVIIDRICRAFDRTAYGKDVVIIEGSGHAGVGAVFDMSNAQVARTLGAKAIIVSSGGIGQPIDEIALNLALFHSYGVPVVGAILNKVLPDKLDLVRDYARRGLERMGVPLLGVIPVVPQLSAPNLQQVAAEIGGHWLNGRNRGAHRRVRSVVVDAMTPRGIMDSVDEGRVIVIPGDRDDIILAALVVWATNGEDAIAGIILTGGIPPHRRLQQMLDQNDVPVLLSNDGSYKVASQIQSMTVKTQPEDSDKIPIIRKLVLENIDLEKIQAAVGS